MALDGADRGALARMLANEMDTAFRRRAVWVLDALALGDEERVLDCGCGRGFYLNFVRGLRPRARLVGVDLSLGELAAMELPEGADGVARVRARAGALPFADDWFDAVIVSEVLEHVDDDLAALAEVRRVLRPGGRAAVTVPNRRFPFAYDPVNAALGAVDRPVRRGLLAGIWTDHRRLYSAEDLLRRASEAGFEHGPAVALTRACIPFQHLLMYGIGKPLLRSGRMPRWLAESADRTTYRRRGGRPNPVDLVRRALLALDRRNERPSPGGRSVNLGVLLRRPTGGGS